MQESRTNLAWDVLLDLGKSGDGALHERLKRALRSVIREGGIGIGTALPPSRKLAGDLGCSRWTVNEAYSQLVAEGYLEARTGSATRVRWSGDRTAEQLRIRRRMPALPPSTSHRAYLTYGLSRGAAGPTPSVNRR
jgi:GntR family transcriptional regulator/MocR family aminotransferase